MILKTSLSITRRSGSGKLEKGSAHLLILASLLFLVACPRQEGGGKQAESALISRARAIHDRVLALDAHIDIEVSFFTPEMPKKMGHQKLASLTAMKSGGLDAAFFTAYVGQGPLTNEGFAEAHASAIDKINRIHHVAEVEMPEEVAIALTPQEVSRIHEQGKIVAIIGKAPVMASHSTHRDFCGLERMWDDEQLLALKNNGGVFHLVGLSMAIKAEPAENTAAISELREKMGFPKEYWPFFLAFEKAAYVNRREYNGRLEAIEKQYPSANVKDFVDHLDDLVERIGIDHVGISSDFYDRSLSLDGWKDAGETFNITLELVRRGYTEEQILKIWSGNTLRVWSEVLEAAPS